MLSSSSFREAKRRKGKKRTTKKVGERTPSSNSVASLFERADPLHLGLIEFDTFLPIVKKIEFTHEIGIFALREAFLSQAARENPTQRKVSIFGFAILLRRFFREDAVDWTGWDTDRLDQSIVDGNLSLMDEVVSQRPRSASSFPPKSSVCSPENSYPDCILENPSRETRCILRALNRMSHGDDVKILDEDEFSDITPMHAHEVLYSMNSDLARCKRVLHQLLQKRHAIDSEIERLRDEKAVVNRKESRDSRLFEFDRKGRIEENARERRLIETQIKDRIRENDNLLILIPLAEKLLRSISKKSLMNSPSDVSSSPDGKSTFRSSSFNESKFSSLSIGSSTEFSLAFGSCSSWVKSARIALPPYLSAHFKRTPSRSKFSRNPRNRVFDVQEDTKHSLRDSGRLPSMSISFSDSSLLRSDSASTFASSRDGVVREIEELLVQSSLASNSDSEDSILHDSKMRGLRFASSSHSSTLSRNRPQSASVVDGNSLHPKMGMNNQNSCLSSRPSSALVRSRGIRQLRPKSSSSYVSIDHLIWDASSEASR